MKGHEIDVSVQRIGDGKAVFEAEWSERGLRVVWLGDADTKVLAKMVSGEHVVRLELVTAAGDRLAWEESYR